MANAALRIGAAGWAIRREHKELFPAVGTHLQRYSQRFNCVEINSSFYRPHRQTTYQRWADSTPDDFRFAVKAPKQITHAKRLRGAAFEMEQFAAEIAGLGRKLGVVLVQLPPSLAFADDEAVTFFEMAAERLNCSIVVEPRHPSWFAIEVEAILTGLSVARAAADPAITPRAAEPGGSAHLVYFRWHGSPRIYYSAYDEPSLDDLAQKIRLAARSAGDAWCIFDNTADGAATLNALQLLNCHVAT
jgi:uncharacterized protein YecE (DUF72 family)